MVRLTKERASAMENQEKDLFVPIINAAPELDFLFALSRRGKVSITISLDGIKQDIDVYIDSIAVDEELRIHRPEPKPNPLLCPDRWMIEGHFWGDGICSWSSIGLPKHRDATNQKYYVWGPFIGTYNKAKRFGQICTKNYIEQKDFKLPEDIVSAFRFDPNYHICPDCKGTGEGPIGFATGIGPYPTACVKCGGKRIIPKQ